jgi:2'-5' RNA ligase
VGLRTFLAIDLPSALRSAIGRKEDKVNRELTGVNWVKPGNLHFTLKFLGDTPESKIDEIKNVMEETVKATGPFEITLRGFGVFPDKRSPRTIWTGIEGETMVLEGLAGHIESALVPLGFSKEERSFRPHLTLARIKKDHREMGLAIEKAGILFDPFIFGRLLVEQVTLFKSELRPTGSVYTKLWAVPLAKS